MEGAKDAKAVVVIIKECFVIKAVLILLLLLFFFLSRCFSFSLSLYFLTRKKKERTNKRNYFSCIRLMNFFINMQAAACHTFISRGWLAESRERERETEKKRK